MTNFAKEIKKVSKLFVNELILSFCDMENSNYKSFVYIEAGIILLLLIGLFVVFGSNNKNKKNLKNEQTTSELRLSEKQNAESSLEKMKSDLALLQKQSDENGRLLAESEAKIDEYQKRINSLNSSNRSLQGNKKELDELQILKSDLENQYAQLKSDNDKLLAQSKNLQDSWDSLEKDKKNLTAELEKTKKYRTDNFLVTATRGKTTEKQVIRARCTKKLNVAFEVPQNLTETISFTIVTPSGSEIKSDDKAVSWYFPVDSRNLTASLSAVSGEFEQSRQVVLNYASKTKLEKGEYKIHILSNGNNIGNCRIILR